MTTQTTDQKAKIYYDKDADINLLKGKKVAIVGYGSQGHAHALNLQESGVKVEVGLYQGSKSWDQAKRDGLSVALAKEACKDAAVIMNLAPDMRQPAVYAEAILPNLKKGMALAFAHGLNIHYGEIKPPKDVDVFMVAPKGPGHLVRRTFQQEVGTPCLMAIHQDATGKAREIALAYAKGIGGTKAGVLTTTFAEETETDLFGEQVVLCGGLTELIRAGFDTLVKAGYQPEVAYFECLHEVKLIVDLIYEGGISNMRKSISETAKYGDITRGRRIITDKTRDTMKEILGEIQNGQFAREWISESKAGKPVYNRLLRQDEGHPIEAVGDKLRSMMSWIKNKKI